MASVLNYYPRKMIDCCRFRLRQYPYFGLVFKRNSAAINSFSFGKNSWFFGAPVRMRSITASWQPASTFDKHYFWGPRISKDCYCHFLLSWTFDSSALVSPSTSYYFWFSPKMALAAHQHFDRRQNPGSHWASACFTNLRSRRSQPYLAATPSLCYSTTFIAISWQLVPFHAWTFDGP